MPWQVACTMHNAQCAMHQHESNGISSTLLRSLQLLLLLAVHLRLASCYILPRWAATRWQRGVLVVGGIAVGSIASLAWLQTPNCVLTRRSGAARLCYPPAWQHNQQD